MRSQPVRILIVDDHEDTVALMDLALTRRGYEVITAGSIQDALAAAETKRFDVVISDIGLPDGSGLELMTQLRMRHPVQGIALTGLSAHEDKARSREAGFAEHLTKPISLLKLEQTIEQLLNHQAL